MTTQTFHCAKILDFSLTKALASHSLGSCTID
jgi:hypothetical protein